MADWEVCWAGFGNCGGVWAECLGLPVGRLSTTGEYRFPGVKETCSTVICGLVDHSCDRIRGVGEVDCVSHQVQVVLRSLLAAWFGSLWFPVQTRVVSGNPGWS